MKLEQRSAASRRGHRARLAALAFLALAATHAAGQGTDISEPGTVRDAIVPHYAPAITVSIPKRRNSQGPDPPQRRMRTLCRRRGWWAGGMERETGSNPRPGRDGAGDGSRTRDLGEMERETGLEPATFSLEG